MNRMNDQKIDHAAEAERIRNMASEYELANATVASGAAVVIGAAANGFAHAQVHATLALAEQQRIANLIALGLARDKFLDPTDPAGVGLLRDDIKEGLGL